MFAAASIFFDHTPLNKTLLTGYFVVGGWQVISMVVHASKGWFTRKKGTRFIYHWIASVAVVTLPMGAFYILYVTAPFMAVFYTGLCYHETYNKMKRPLDLIR